MSTHKIIVGAGTSSPTYTFEDDFIETISQEKSIGIIGDELNIDTFSATVRYTSTTTVPRFVSDYGSSISYYKNDILVDKFYVESIERSGKNKYTINGVSVVGILDKVNHRGGVYSGSTFETVLCDIVSETLTGLVYETDYGIDSEVKKLKVFGYLPYGNARENLHKLLMAYNVSMVRTSPGYITFKFLSESDTPIQISDNNIYDEGSATYGNMPTEIDITEYSYIPLATLRSDLVEEKKIYDNTVDCDPAVNEVITFNTPIAYSDIRVEGSLTVSTIWYTYAIVSGIGTIYGKEYTVNSKVRKFSTGVSGKDNIVTLSDNTLVTVQNSKAIANRLIDYYGNAETYEISTLADISTTGGTYTFKNSFCETQTGILSKMSKNISGVVKSDCEMVTNLNYFGSASLYTNKTVITEDGTFTVPDGCTSLRIVLIGGGRGGDQGSDGESGEDEGSSSDTNAPEGGDGGAAGTAGTGGKVYSFDMEVASGSTLTFDIGTGGRGGYGGATTGTIGTETKVYKGTTLVHSSDEGSTPSIGYYEVFDNKLYAAKGEAGIDGGKGGNGGIVAIESTYNPFYVPSTSKGTAGESVGTYSGGSYGDTYTYHVTQHIIIDGTETETSEYYNNYAVYWDYDSSEQTGIGSYVIFQGTPGGGGACGNANGTAGTVCDSYNLRGTHTNLQRTTVSTTEYWGEYSATYGPAQPVEGTTVYWQTGGDGGTVSDRQTNSKADGSGGHGGHGGGGGGALGRILLGPKVLTTQLDSRYLGDQYYYCVAINGNTGDYCIGSPGSGGAGCPGEDGAGGCAIIYYYT